MSSPITFDRFIRGLLGLVILGAVVALIYWLSGVLIPFFVAWVVAYLLYPVVRFFQYRCHVRSRIVAIVLTLALTCGAIAGFGYLVVPPMVSECTHLKDVALEYVQKGTDSAAVPSSVQKFLQSHASEYNVENLLKEKDVVSAIKSTVPKVWNVLWSTAGVIVNIVASLIGLLYLLFLLTDYEKYANGWINFVPRTRRRFAAQLVSDIEHGMAGYFRGQALVALSNCVMFSVGFAVIGFPMPVALGCLIGVISFVPYLQVVGFVPATLLALLKAVDSGQNFWVLMGLVVAVYLVVQVLQDTIFTPRIMGKIMGLPPAIILLALSVWGYALGIVGLIVALPVTTLMISYYRRYVVGGESISDPEPAADEASTAFPGPVPSPGTVSAEDEALEREAGVYVAPPESMKLSTPNGKRNTESSKTAAESSKPFSEDDNAAQEAGK